MQKKGLYEIQPYPSSCLSFYGPSGTGKTIVAEAIVHKLNKKLLELIMLMLRVDLPITFYFMAKKKTNPTMLFLHIYERNVEKIC